MQSINNAPYLKECKGESMKGSKVIVLHRVEEELEESEGGRKCWERIGMWFCKLSFFYLSISFSVPYFSVLIDLHYFPHSFLVRERRYSNRKIRIEVGLKYPVLQYFPGPDFSKQFRKKIKS